MTIDIIGQMRTSSPPLLAMFRSQLQGELLAQVLLSPGQSISDLARGLGAPVATVQREVARLVDAGILATNQVGRARLVRPDESNPALPPLRELVMIAFGPRYVVAAELSHVADIEVAFLFGSWAARHSGEVGPQPGDVDVLVVGHPDPDDVFDASERARHQLGREVNAAVISPAGWATGQEPFLQQVRQRPLVQIIGRSEEPV